jgi:hypothetical protein
MAGCSQSEEIPEGIIPRDSMVNLLADMQLAEARIQSISLERNDSTKQVSYGYYKYIFTQHHTTPLQFKKSFDYYSHHLTTFSNMYDDVITRLSKMEAESTKKK